MHQLTLTDANFTLSPDDDVEITMNEYGRHEFKINGDLHVVVSDFELHDGSLYSGPVNLVINETHTQVAYERNMLAEQNAGLIHENRNLQENLNDLAEVHSDLLDRYAERTARWSEAETDLRQARAEFQQLAELIVRSMLDNTATT